ncbi:hypothetical protein [Morganella morganii]|uniref:hypothetical protein n=1 Tax=Morganella morganii TaxID=582 RepID=UPI001BDB628C|nr:hypothetical protein [Morganella morganii]MBT0383811.1 hypothetical protein [Morganella morganii subsp. morganii]HBZ7486593.1 hypothetical protein [Klebsiella pneumoniae]
MPGFGIKAFDDQGRDTVYMLSNFAQPLLPISGSGSQTYNLPVGAKLYAFPVSGVFGGIDITVKGNTVSWRNIASPNKLIIIFSMGVL